jgi:NIMA (never in mitosis gene a)-related kinase
MELFTVDPLNEVKVLKSLDHPNIISTYDSFIHNNKLCILMEYADNGKRHHILCLADLALTIKEHKLANKFIKEETVLY